MTDTSGLASLKAILAVLDNENVLSEAQVKHALFMRERFFCTVYDAVRAMLPAGLWFDDQGRQKVNDKTITDVLGRYDVHPGDVFFLPAGRIHAIGAGTFVAEIQQTSDITYRIYDYGRLGLDGRPRELHIEQAKDAIDFTVYPDYRTQYSKVKNEETQLVKCKYFTTSLFDLDKPASKNLSALDSFVVVICVAGKGVLVDNESDGSVHKMELHQGETLLVPASSSTIEFHPDGAMTCLTSYLE